MITSCCLHYDYFFHRHNHIEGDLYRFYHENDVNESDGDYEICSFEENDFYHHVMSDVILYVQLNSFYLKMMNNEVCKINGVITVEFFQTWQRLSNPSRFIEFYIPFSNGNYIFYSLTL